MGPKGRFSKGLEEVPEALMSVSEAGEGLFGFQEILGAFKGVPGVFIGTLWSQGGGLKSVWVGLRGFKGEKVLLMGVSNRSQEISRVLRGSQGRIRRYHEISGAFQEMSVLSQGIQGHFREIQGFQSALGTLRKVWGVLRCPKRFQECFRRFQMPKTILKRPWDLLEPPKLYLDPPNCP